MSLIIAAIFFLSLLQDISFAQQSKFDAQIPTEQEIRNSLVVARRLSVQPKLSAKEIHQIYFAEKNIGRSVWGASERISNLYDSQKIKAINYHGDISLSEQCLLYVQTNWARFRVVDDGWKGEENFIEPNRYWMDQIKKYYPNSVEAMEIEFDRDFKEFIRRFDIDEDAKGKTCDQYYSEELKKNLRVYLEVYSKEEIDNWPSECKNIRKEFQLARSQLLQKFKNAFFTKILQGIDPTTIVKFHSVC